MDFFYEGIFLHDSRVRVAGVAFLENAPQPSLICLAICSIIFNVLSAAGTSLAFEFILSPSLSCDIFDYHASMRFPFYIENSITRFAQNTISAVYMGLFFLGWMY